jgi:enoyl-CoA hydratase/carnithine racemase
MLSTEMTTGPSDLLSELNAGVSTLTLNRPSARNALTP